MCHSSVEGGFSIEHILVNVMCQKAYSISMRHAKKHDVLNYCLVI